MDRTLFDDIAESECRWRDIEGERSRSQVVAEPARHWQRPRCEHAACKPGSSGPSTFVFDLTSLAATLDDGRLWTPHVGLRDLKCAGGRHSSQRLVCSLSSFSTTDDRPLPSSGFRGITQNSARCELVSSPFRRSGQSLLSSDHRVLMLHA